MLLDAGVPNPASVVVPILVRLEKLSIKARSQGLNVEERHNSKRRIILQFLLIVYPIWAGTDPPRLLHSSFLARQHLNRLFLFLWCNFRGETKTNIGGPMKKIPASWRRSQLAAFFPLRRTCDLRSRQSSRMLALPEGPLSRNRCVWNLPGSVMPMRA